MANLSEIGGMVLKGAKEVGKAIAWPAGGFAAILGAAGIGLKAGDVMIAPEREATCQALADGDSMGEAESTGRVGSEAPEFLSPTSLNAQIADCRKEFQITVSDGCAAQAILVSIDLGTEVPRPLIEDARAIQGECK